MRGLAPAPSTRNVFLIYPTTALTFAVVRPSESAARPGSFVNIDDGGAAWTRGNAQRYVSSAARTSTAARQQEPQQDVYQVDKRALVVRGLWPKDSEASVPRCHLHRPTPPKLINTPYSRANCDPVTRRHSTSCTIGLVQSVRS